jgi:hypothetical protein
MTTTNDTKRARRTDLLADLDQTISLLERLTTIVERDVVSKEFPNLTAQHIGLAYLRVAETASRLAADLHLTTY